MPETTAAGFDAPRGVRGLYPVDQRGSSVKNAGAYAAAAVEHAGDHEQAGEVLGVGSHFVDYLFIVFNAHSRVELGVGPAVVHEEFAAVATEGGEVGIVGVDDLAEFVRLRG